MSLPIPQPLQKQSLILERTTKKRSDLDWRGLAPQYVRKDVASYEFESAARDDRLEFAAINPTLPLQHNTPRLVADILQLVAQTATAMRTTAQLKDRYIYTHYEGWRSVHA